MNSSPRFTLPEPAELFARMFPRRRIILTVSMNLDPVPGAFHDAEDACRHVQAILKSAIGHYDPLVSLDADAEVSG